MVIYQLVEYDFDNHCYQPTSKLSHTPFVGVAIESDELMLANYNPFQKVIKVWVELPITRAFFGIDDEKYQIGDNFKRDVITSMVEIAPNRIRFFDGDKILADLTNPTKIEYV